MSEAVSSSHAADAISNMADAGENSTTISNTDSTKLPAATERQPIVINEASSTILTTDSALVNGDISNNSASSKQSVNSPAPLAKQPLTNTIKGSANTTSHVPVNTDPPAIVIKKSDITTSDLGDIIKKSNIETDFIKSSNTSSTRPKDNTPKVKEVKSSHSGNDVTRKRIIQESSQGNYKKSTKPVVDSKPKSHSKVAANDAAIAKANRKRQKNQRLLADTKSLVGSQKNLLHDLGSLKYGLTRLEKETERVRAEIANWESTINIKAVREVASYMAGRDSPGPYYSDDEYEPYEIGASYEPYVSKYEPYRSRYEPYHSSSYEPFDTKYDLPRSYEPYEPTSKYESLEPVSRYGVEPVSRYGVEPVSRYGVEPVSRYGVEPVSRYGVEPVSRYETPHYRYDSDLGEDDVEPVSRYETRARYAPRYRSSSRFDDNDDDSNFGDDDITAPTSSYRPSRFATGLSRFNPDSSYSSYRASPVNLGFSRPSYRDDDLESTRSYGRSSPVESTYSEPAYVSRYQTSSSAWTPSSRRTDLDRETKDTSASRFSDVANRLSALRTKLSGI